MKILLTTLNAKYVHTSLALWYLYQFCRENKENLPDYPELVLKEFNINQELSWVFGEIYLEKAEVVAFSCNIWNIEQIESISRRLKMVAPETVIIWGGPEVSAFPEDIMSKNEAVDFIVIGEGELTFKEWILQFGQSRAQNGADFKQIAGLAYRNGDGVARTKERETLKDLGFLPFPYPDNLHDFRLKLVYYESSRGCPFHCQYCLSANEQGVRFFPLERVKEELLRFIKAEILQVKFVDRSFNCNVARAKEIWKFLINNPGRTNFHFEIVGDLLDEESIEILGAAPPGLFQCEIGVQSTNPQTLAMIKRTTDFKRLSRQVSKLLEKTSVWAHLDLIAGLPGEDYQSFSRTFNENLLLQPQRLQLGFLKLLKGSGLRNNAADYGYKFTIETPYEVLENKWISYDELLKLKTIEDLLERFYNSGRFKLTFKYLLAQTGVQFDTPFHLFEKFAAWWKERNFDQFSHKTKDQYEYLLRFLNSILEKDQEIIVRNFLKYDLLSNERMVELPEWAGGEARARDPVLKNLAYQFLKEPDNRALYIPEFDGLELREVQRRVLFEEFDFDPVEVASHPSSGPVLKKQIILFVYNGGKVKTYNIRA